MIIRPYREEDDAGLMALERLCPRGAPNPFVHYRRRFVERAEVFREHVVLVIEVKNTVVGAGAAAVKDTLVAGHPMRLGYIFDVRVSPLLRGQGLASTIVESLEGDLINRRCDGAYAHIVATNRASMNLFTKLGYGRRRQLRFLTYQPMPLFLSPPLPVRRFFPSEDNLLGVYRQHDLFVDDVIESLRPYHLECWQVLEKEASLSLYDQSLLFQQIPADAPWPTPAQMARRGRHWRLLHPMGEPILLEQLFATMRDTAVTEGIDKLTMLVDAQEPLPSFFYAETSDQREYVIVSRSFGSTWDGLFGPQLYSDPREL